MEQNDLRVLIQGLRYGGHWLIQFLSANVASPMKCANSQSLLYFQHLTLSILLNLSNKKFLVFASTLFFDNLITMSNFLLGIAHYPVAFSFFLNQWSLDIGTIRIAPTTRNLPNFSMYTSRHVKQYYFIRHVCSPIENISFKVFQASKVYSVENWLGGFSM